MLGWLDSLVMPALAQRMLIGPKWSCACCRQDEMEASFDMSPWTLKTDGDGVAVSEGLRSWAVTLHPAADCLVVRALYSIY